MLLRLVLGFLLLTTAGAKLYDLGWWATDLTTSLKSAVLPVVIFEAGLGIWLLSGRFERALFCTSFVTFVAFATYNIVAHGLGLTSCGCFGRVFLHPLVGFAIDVAAAIGLWLWQPHGVRWLTALIVGLILGPIGAVTLTPQTTAVLSGRLASGKHQLPLEPERLVGQRLPILKYVEDGHRFEIGEWLIMIVHEGCPVCRDELVKFVTARDFRQRAVVEIDPASEAYASRLTVGVQDVRLIRMPVGIQVVVETPTYFRLSSGTIAKTYKRLSDAIADVAQP